MQFSNLHAMTLPLSITTLLGQPILFSPGLPEAFASYRLQGAQAFFAHSENYGYLFYQQIANNGYTAWVSHFILSKPADFKVTANVDDLLMHYTVKGNMGYIIENKESITSDHHLNIIISRRLKNIIRFKMQGTYTAINIHIPLTFLQEFSDSFPVVKYFTEKIQTSNEITLLDNNMVAHERLRGIVQDITERQLPNAAGEKYREQKIGELIIESLDMLSRYLTDASGLSAADHERGEKTEVHLLKHLNSPSPPTLRQLSRFAGTNEKKLEDIFKIRHGVTVYDFFQNARMRIIYRKLTETNIPLQDLADEFGYTDYSSFSYAVKKRFNFSPRELRKKNLA